MGRGGGRRPRRHNPWNGSLRAGALAGSSYPGQAPGKLAGANAGARGSRDGAQVHRAWVARGLAPEARGRALRRTGGGAAPEAGLSRQAALSLPASASGSGRGCPTAPPAQPQSFGSAEKPAAHWRPPRCVPAPSASPALRRRCRFPAPPPPPSGSRLVAATATAAAGRGPASACRAGVESQPEPLPAAPP